jgi:hypothetical protein
MSAREVIRLIESLPANEQLEVFAFVDAKKRISEIKESDKKPVDEAIDLVFENYDKLLAKLAQ